MHDGFHGLKHMQSLFGMSVSDLDKFGLDGARPTPKLEVAPLARREICLGSVKISEASREPGAAA